MRLNRIYMVYGTRMSPTKFESYAEPKIWDAEVNVDEILEVLNGMSDNKAPGDDRVPAKFFKYAPIELTEVLREVFSDILNGGEIDKCFPRSIIFPIFKKGDVADVQNYRGISL